MNSWTEKHILGLHKAGKIRGYHASKGKGFSSDKKKVVKREKPKGLIWLEWNLLYWANERLLEFHREYVFDDKRQWRFDFAISPTGLKFAVEYEGIYNQGMNGHTSQKHFNKDLEKYTRAQVLGWQVVRVTAKNYTTVLKTLDELIKAKN